jgi:hypothetical protein
MTSKHLKLKKNKASAAPKTSAVFADDDAEDPLSNAPPAAAPPALHVKTSLPSRKM